MDSELPEVCLTSPTLEKCWYAYKLSKQNLKKKYNNHQISAYQGSKTCKEIKELIKALKDKKTKCNYTIDELEMLALGGTKITRYRSELLNADFEKLHKDWDAMMKLYDDESNDQLPGDAPLPIIDLQIPDVELNFPKELPKDVNLLSDHDDPCCLAEALIMDETAEPGFGMMTVEDWDLFLGTDPESSSNVIRDLHMSFNEEITAPIQLPDTIRTPTKRPSQINVETPSKRIRRALDHSFGDDPSPGIADIDAAERDLQAPVLESIPPVPMDVSVEMEPEPEQEAPVASITEVPADTLPTQETGDTLENLPGLIVELNVSTSKSKKRKKTGLIIDKVTEIPGDVIRNSQRNDIHTVPFEAVRANPGPARLSADDLFNQLATQGSRKFRSLGRPLMAHFQQLKFGVPSNVRDVNRRASTEKTAELTPGIRPGPSTVQSQKTNKAPDNIEVPDHDLSPQNQIAEETIEPIEPLVAIPSDDIHPEPPVPVIDNSSELPVINTGTTLEAAFVHLTTDEIDDESNESLMSGPPVRNNPSQSRGQSDNIIDIEKIPANQRLSPSPSSRWTKANLMAHMDMLFSQGYQVLRFDELVSPEDFSKQEYVRLHHYLLFLASENKVSLDQNDDDEIIWIQKK
ncbi:uncharacterized protein LOC130668440 [Microplitis mediator]|uniref:uncharacterized protein LOC130668440 n=1 Tax=Microplitis mediator TaxID=375433 RepID=UPI002557A27C|nr:uncharacterized protein LOC130668440 [Microplitis mediator]